MTNDAILVTPNAELLKAHIEGQPEAFTALFEAHHALVYRTCLRILKNHADAADATQATFIILDKRCRTLQKDINLAGWLYRTACFVSRQHIRSVVRQKKREQEAQVMHDANAQQNNDAWKDIQVHLDDAMRLLSGRYRDVVVLRFLEGKSTSETAAQLAISESAVTTRLTRAMEQLRNYFFGRGIKLSVSVLGVILAKNAAAAPIPTLVVPSLLTSAGTISTAAAVSENASAMVQGALAKTGFFFMKSINVYIFISWILCMYTWIKNGCSIPRWVHYLAAGLFTAGLAVTIIYSVNYILTYQIILWCLVAPPIAAYVGWLWMFGPAFAQKEDS